MRNGHSQISLSPKLSKIVNSEIASGRYASADEVVGEALQLLKENHAQEAAYQKKMKEKILVGLEQAKRGELIDGDQAFDELEEELAASRKKA